MLKKFYRVLGTTIPIIIAVLTLSEAPEQLGKWKAYWDELSAYIGINWAAFWGGSSGKTTLLVIGLAIGLVAWDVPQRLVLMWKQRNNPSLAEEARQRRVRQELRDFLSRLYDSSASQAVGGAYHEADFLVATMRASQDPMKVLAANLLTVIKAALYERINLVLAARGCQTDEEVRQCLHAWGGLFQQYQELVLWTHESYLALGISPWTQAHYVRWRAHDSGFIEQMKTLEHMEGCHHIAPLLRQVGWGLGQRPEIVASA